MVYYGTDSEDSDFAKHEVEKEKIRHYCNYFISHSDMSGAS